MKSDDAGSAVVGGEGGRRREIKAAEMFVRS